MKYKVFTIMFLYNINFVFCSQSEQDNLSDQKVCVKKNLFEDDKKLRQQDLVLDPEMILNQKSFKFWLTLFDIQEQNNHICLDVKEDYFFVPFSDQHDQSSDTQKEDAVFVYRSSQESFSEIPCTGIGE